MFNMKKLNVNMLRQEASKFSSQESQHSEISLFGVTDGKAVGTYLEHKFQKYLISKGFEFQMGNSASGIDFPDLGVDMKVTSIRQPQSSCPFKSARQKVYGLGYALMVFVYEKTDDHALKLAKLNIKHTIFVDAEQTADFQMTSGLLAILANAANKDDVVAFLSEKNLPIDDIGLQLLAEEILKSPPLQGYLTISNALQWRLQYARVIEKAGEVNGVHAVFQGSQR
jgi:hypothetical protein